MILRFLNWQGVTGIAAALALVGLLVAERIDAQHWRKESARFETLYGDEQLAFARTTAAYREAADTARAEDRANAARVTAEQQSINERTADDFEKRLAAARRAAADRLRGTAAAGAADPRSGGAAAVPGLSTAAVGAAEAAGDHGLPAAAVRADHALIATEQAIQLDELIAWVKRQAAVDPNSSAAAPVR
jgi:hypothetical protein